MAVGEWIRDETYPLGIKGFSMSGFPSSFPSSSGDIFDEYDEFVPDHIPELGLFLEDHDVLVDERHISFHELTKELFEECGVYDMTFGYNLAQLNLDYRHPGEGYRYAEKAEDQSVLRAEFTPTTPFCPQSRTLTIGSFRAWNGLIDRHDYNLVRVRVHPMHHKSAEINDELTRIEEEFLETGDVRRVSPSEDTAMSSSEYYQPRGQTSDSPDAPF